jgi:hypothetical protein
MVDWLEDRAARKRVLLQPARDYWARIGHGFHVINFSRLGLAAQK